MFNISVIYDYESQGMLPAWMLIKPNDGCFDWKSEAFYIPIEAPFQKISREELNDYSLGLSVTQADLVMSVKHPNYFGIFVPRLKQRINQMRGEKYTPFFHLADIEHLVVQMTDIEIVMEMNVLSKYAWRPSFLDPDF
ncbi:hypothetical protein FHS19_006879 [Paenibacillus rhizosphaerae]|uniref:Uncharacterized protein n=1 Tax=Paenibacillus rhizosphaerae TaxID=297318 RepID=A0A839TZY0_9BACL|nr:hypothetical protein [Paenibacillus rhizosphaerae]MBB3132152.1 hypothetical protein [Paenibacillus rhizosphaerae]